MTRRPRLLQILLFALAAIGLGSEARAACVISNITSVSTTVANLGTYTSPTTPAEQIISITVQGQYISAGFTSAGCDLGMYFVRSSLPASMTVTGGGSATLPYTFGTASGGGNSIIHTGAGVPPNSGMIIRTFTPPFVVSTGTYSLSFTFYARMVPGTPQQGGSYMDDLTMRIAGDVLILVPIVVNERAFSVLANVTKTCTIGGVANPAADSATIPIVAGNVVTTAIPKSYANVVCNSPSSLTLTSLGGALTGPASPGGAFDHRINYTASALFSGAIPQINTATVPGASGPEASAASATTGAMPQGTLAVTITPHANALPLARGNYADTLRISITPN